MGNDSDDAMEVDPTPAYLPTPNPPYESNGRGMTRAGATVSSSLTHHSRHYETPAPPSAPYRGGSSHRPTPPPSSGSLPSSVDARDTRHLPLSSSLATLSGGSELVNLLPTPPTSSSTPSSSSQYGTDDEFSLSSSHVGKVWAEFDRLNSDRLCLHCATSRWQHSLLPVCSKCQPRLQRLTCDFCVEEFLQHRLLIEAERRFQKPLCISCARNLSRFGPPERCKLCKNKSVFGGNAVCDRCSQMSHLYGSPMRCEKCGNNAAFKREPDKMQKIDNMLLCFNCTTSYKREKYKSQKRNRHASQQSNSRPPPSPRRRRSADSSDASSRSFRRNAGRGRSSTPHRHEKGEVSARRQLEEQKELIDSLKAQVTTLQQQLKHKDVEVVSFAQKIEQDNFLLRKEVEENERRFAREELRIAQLTKELADVERGREREVTRLIDSNHEERERLNDLIEKLETSRDELQAEVEKRRLSAKEAKAAAKESQNLLNQYKAATEKRVQRLAEKFRKTVQRLELRARERNRALHELKREVARLEDDKERYMRQEQIALGLIEAGMHNEPPNKRYKKEEESGVSSMAGSPATATTMTPEASTADATAPSTPGSHEGGESEDRTESENEEDASGDVKME